MKKIYLSILAVSFAMGVSAQEKNISTERDGSERVAPVFKVTSPSATVQPTYTEKASYLTEDFEGTFPPTGWAVYSGPASTVTNPTQEWHHRTTGGYPENADAFNGTNPGGCAAVLYFNSTNQHDEYLTTPETTLPAGACRVAFDFATSIYWHATTLGGSFDNADIQVLVSDDAGASWDNILWQEDSLVLLDASYSNDYETYIWKRAYVDLTAYQGQDVVIGFYYNGLDGAPFYLDNVVIEDTPDNDIEIADAWTGDIILDYDYSMVPEDQVKPMRIGVAVKNIGGLAQTFDVTADLNDGTVSVFNDVTSVTLTPAEADTVWFDTGYTPTAIGDYTVEFTLSADDNLANNQRTAMLSTTEYIYAHDYTVDQAFRFDVDDAVAMGNVFIVENNALLQGADIKFETGTTDNLYTIIYLWEVGANIQDLTQITAVEYTIPSSVIGNGNFTTIPFLAPVSVNAGSSYVLEIKKVNHDSDRLFLGGSDDGDDDFSTVCFGPFGAASAVNWFTGWGFSPAIRMNFDETLTIDENTLTGVSVYPNPSEGVITVTNDKNTTNSIEVHDMLGKVVYTSTASTSTTIDLSGNGTGVYIVKVSNENGSLVERVVIR